MGCSSTSGVPTQRNQVLAFLPSATETGPSSVSLVLEREWWREEVQRFNAILDYIANLKPA